MDGHSRPRVDPASAVPRYVRHDKEKTDTVKVPFSEGCCVRGQHAVTTVRVSACEIGRAPQLLEVLPVRKRLATAGNRVSGRRSADDA
jgi:hypothetical protein